MTKVILGLVMGVLILSAATSLGENHDSQAQVEVTMAVVFAILYHAESRRRD